MNCAIFFFHEYKINVFSKKIKQKKQQKLSKAIMGDSNTNRYTTSKTTTTGSVWGYNESNGNREYDDTYDNQQQSDIQQSSDDRKMSSSNRRRGRDKLSASPDHTNTEEYNSNTNNAKKVKRSNTGSTISTTNNNIDQLEKERRERMARLREENEKEEKLLLLSTTNDNNSKQGSTNNNNTTSTSTSASVNNTSTNSFLIQNKDPQKDIIQITDTSNIDELDMNEQMKLLLGFDSNFTTTKYTKVTDNHTTSARGIVSKNKARKYRQYMNRTNGFNRPLDKMN